MQNWQVATIGAAGVIGMLIGAVVLGRLSDRIGRRPIFQVKNIEALLRHLRISVSAASQLSLFVSSIFGFLSAMAPNIFVFIVLRGCLGVGYGGMYF